MLWDPHALRIRRATFLTAALSLPIWIASPSIAFAGVIRLHDLRNGAALTVANDLTLVFSAKPRADKSDPAFPDAVTATDAAGNTTAPTQTAQGGFNVTWQVGDLPSDVKPGEALTIKFRGPQAIKILKRRSFWTADGNKIDDALAAIGTPPEILFANGQAIASFVNPETFPVIYSDIQLFVDNNLSNFNLQEFAMATGSLLLGLATSITLNPGETLELPFGPVDRNAYQLVMANVAPASSSTDTFRIGTAASIAEPFGLLQFGVGAMIMVAYRRSRRITSRARRV